MPSEQPTHKKTTTELPTPQTNTPQHKTTVLPDLLTVVEIVYHQPFAEDTVAIESRFSRPLKTIEQLYRRRYAIDEEYKPLDTGWIEKPSMLIIINEEGKHLQTNPTADQIRELADKIIEITPTQLLDFSILIPPGESARFQPSDVSCLSIRSQSGVALISIAALPE